MTLLDTGVGFSVGGLSKSMGLSGLRIGWTLGSPRQAEAIRSVGRLLHVDMPTPSLQFANQALNHWTQAIERNLNRATLNRETVANTRALTKSHQDYPFKRGTYFCLRVPSAFPQTVTGEQNLVTPSARSRGVWRFKPSCTRAHVLYSLERYFNLTCIWAPGGHMAKSVLNYSAMILALGGLAFAIGCGDGKRQRREPVKKANGGLGANSAGKNGLPNGLKQNADGTLSGTTTSAAESAVDNAWAAYVAQASAIDLKQLNGSYSFEGSGAYAKVAQAGASTFALVVRGFKFDNTSNALQANEQGVTSGQAQKKDDSARLLFARRLTFTNGQPSGEEDASYVSSVTNNAQGQAQLNDYVTASSAGGKSLNEILRKNQQTNGAEIYKQADGFIRIVITFQEGSTTRKISLNYKPDATSTSGGGATVKRTSTQGEQMQITPAVEGGAPKATQGLPGQDGDGDADLI